MYAALQNDATEEVMIKALNLILQGGYFIMAQPELPANTRKTMYWKAGIIGSLIGGLVFGMLMAMMGMLPTIAGMMGSKSPIVGFIVHMVISLLFGVVFTIFAGMLKWNAIISGVLFGIILWVLFPFMLMPMMMGMSQMAFKITSASILSLMGHVIYGLITGIAYKKMAK